MIITQPIRQLGVSMYALFCGGFAL